MITRKAGTFRFIPKWALALSQTNFSDRYNRAFCRLWPHFPDYGTRKIGGRAVRRIIPLGTHCLTADLLISAGLRREAYPFDWLMMPPELIAACIIDDFRTLTDRRLITLSEPDGSGSASHRLYETMGAPDIFSHIKCDQDIDRIEARARRFQQACLHAEDDPILFFMIARRHFDVAKAFDAILHALRTKTANFEFLCVQIEQSRPGQETFLRLGREVGRHRLFNFSPVSDEARLGYFPDPLDGLNLLRLVENYHLELDART